MHCVTLNSYATIGIHAEPDDYTIGLVLPSIGSVISGMNLDQLMVQPASITVMLVNDDVTEGNEQFTLNLERFEIDRNRVVLRPNISLIIIQDDDGKRNIS